MNLLFISGTRKLMKPSPTYVTFKCVKTKYLSLWLWTKPSDVKKIVQLSQSKETKQTK